MRDTCFAVNAESVADLENSIATEVKYNRATSCFDHDWLILQEFG